MNQYTDTPSKAYGGMLDYTDTPPFTDEQRAWVVQAEIKRAERQLKLSSSADQSSVPERLDRILEIAFASNLDPQLYAVIWFVRRTWPQ